MFVQVAAPLRQADEVIDYFLTLPEVEENPLPLSERVNPYGAVMQSVKRYTPVGVVAAIAAYNYPFFTAFWKVMPALVAGNCVIMRPSPLTPISALVFAEAAAAAEPAARRAEHSDRERDRGRTPADARSGRGHGGLHRLHRGRQAGDDAGLRRDEAAAARTRRQVRADLPARRGRPGGRGGGGGLHRARGPGLRARHPHLRAGGRERPRCSRPCRQRSRR